MEFGLKERYRMNIISKDIEKATLLLLERADLYNRSIYNEIKPFLRGDILEVGCGIGNLTKWLIKSNKITVADKREDYLKIIRNKFATNSNLLKSIIWDIRREYPSDINHLFDTIICSNVLEHIEEDELVLKRFYNLLAEDGRIIVIVPALKIIYNRLDQELGHLRRYSRKELYLKFKGSRFKICKIKYFNLFGILGWFLNGKILKRNIIPGRQLYIFNNLFPILLKIEKIFPNILGQSLIAVGEK